MTLGLPDLASARRSGLPALLPRPGGGGVPVAVQAAVLSFFAVLALALGLAAGRIAADWAGDAARTATLQLLAPSAAMEAQARAALEVLRTTQGISAVRIIEIEEQQAILAPWLGTDAAFDALPLPLLIEVTVDPKLLDRAALDARLAGEAPGAVFDDHAVWRRPLAASAERLRIFAFASLGALGLAFGAGLVGAARGTLARHGREIATLSLVGARPGFIAGLFARPCARNALVGGIVGTVLATGLLALLPQTDERGFFLIGIGLRGWHWALPAAVPIVVAGLAWGVMRACGRREAARVR